MAHLRKKGRWLDHARAMIEGESLAKTAALCGVHPTTAFRWRHRFLRAPASDKPRSLRGIVEADETFVLESFKGRWSDLSRKACKRGGTARRAGLYQDNIPILVARDRKGTTFDAVLPQVDSASVGAALAGLVTPGNHLIGDGGKAIAAFARRAGIPFHVVPAPGKPTREAPHLHINNVNAYHSRLKQWLARFNGVATKNLPNYLGWRRALEAWGDQTRPARLDQKRNRERSIPTANAIRASPPRVKSPNNGERTKAPDERTGPFKVALSQRDAIERTGAARHNARMATMTKAAPPRMVKIEAIPCTAMPAAATVSSDPAPDGVLRKAP